MKSEAFMETVGQRVDDLVNLDIPSRNAVAYLYPPARKKAGGPICLEAAKRLCANVRAGDTVFVATGFIERPAVTPVLGESDGPPGAAALARALFRGLGAVPFLLVEEQFVAGMRSTMLAAGLVPLTPDEAVTAVRTTDDTCACTVLDFPVTHDDARVRSSELIDRYRPAAVVVVEKAGMNDRSMSHSMGGGRNDQVAKVDYLVLEATRRGILTIGVGDGGNEIGMGLIADDIKDAPIPNFARCKCGCGGGIVCATPTDVLVTASVSNFGAYGIAACLALLGGRPEVFHDAALEREMLVASARAAFIDGESGYAVPAVDGLPGAACEAVVTLLGQIVQRGLRSLRQEGNHVGSLNAAR